MAQLKGVITALATPFDSKGELDLGAWEKLISTQIQAGIQGVVVAGSTGESPTLTRDERKQLLKSALEFCRGTKTEVIAGTGTNNTQTTLEYSKDAELLGIKTLLVVTPYYNRPTQAGLEAHYTKLADSTGCDLVLYNVPGRTGVSLGVDTVARLAKHPRIVGLKEAAGDLGVVRKLIDMRSNLGKPFALLSGDDPTFVQAKSLGADGVISIASNILARTMVRLDQSLDATLFGMLYPIFCDLCMEPNPVPVKQVLEWQGIMRADVRLPLVKMAPENIARLKQSYARASA